MVLVLSTFNKNCVANPVLEFNHKETNMSLFRNNQFYLIHFVTQFSVLIKSQKINADGIKFIFMLIFFNMLPIT